MNRTANSDDLRCVAIVMGTFQGEKFLEDQLHSIAAQNHVNWRLFVSDDGSADRTREIVETFRAARPKQDAVILSDGPRKGFAANFLTALCQSGQAGYYAFADQDDIWEESKLARALSVLEKAPTDRPALYCSRTRLIDETGRSIGLSPAFLRSPSFANALVQNIGGANTMVMNRAAQELLCAAGPDMDIFSHDWWAYQLISGAGGLVYYDIEPSVLYRQHRDNLVGKNNDTAARIRRMKLLLTGQFQKWMDRHIHALSQVRHLLTPQNQALLDVFAEMRAGSVLRRLTAFRKSGIYRQTRIGNLGLIVAVMLNKL